MFDHLGIVVRDLHTASVFYLAVLPPTGIVLMENNARPDGTGWLVFSTGAPESPFFVVAAGRPTFWANEHETARSPAHVAFKAPSRAAVDAFHRAGLVAGATNNGDPGVRRGPLPLCFPDRSRRQQHRGRRLRRHLNRRWIPDGRVLGQLRLPG